MVGLVALPLALGFGVSSGHGRRSRAGHRDRGRRRGRGLRRQPVQVSGPTGAMTVVLVPIIADPRPRRGPRGRPARRADPDRARLRRRRPLHPLRPGARSSRASPSGSPRSSRCSRCPPPSASTSTPRRCSCWPRTPSRPGSPHPAWAPLGMAAGRGGAASWSLARLRPGLPGLPDRRGRRDRRQRRPRPRGRDDRPRYPPGCPRPSLPRHPARPISTPCCCPRSPSPPWPRWRACCRRRWPTR